MNDELKARVGKVLGRIPSGIFVLTVRHENATAAMLASWVQQAAFDPPAVSIAIVKSRPIVGLIRASGVLAVSIVPEADTTLMKRFARPVKDGEDPFAGLATQSSPAGCIVLSDSLGWLEAKLIQICDFGGDHDLLIGQITDGAILREGKSFTHQRGNGFHY